MEKTTSKASIPIDSVQTHVTSAPGTIEEIEVSNKGLDMKSDEALDFLGCHPNDFVYSAKEAKHVRWKLDLILLPMVSNPSCVRLNVLSITCLKDGRDICLELYGQSCSIGSINLWY